MPLADGRRVLAWAGIAIAVHEDVAAPGITASLSDCHLAVARGDHEGVDTHHGGDETPHLLAVCAVV